jgi:hypothetical protein
MMISYPRTAATEAGWCGGGGGGVKKPACAEAPVASRRPMSNAWKVRVMAERVVVVCMVLVLSIFLVW